MPEVDEADFERSITKAGVAVSTCRYGHITIAAKDVSILLFVERGHDCPEKQDATQKRPSVLPPKMPARSDRRRERRSTGLRDGKEREGYISLHRTKQRDM